MPIAHRQTDRQTGSWWSQSDGVRFWPWLLIWSASPATIWTPYSVLKMDQKQPNLVDFLCLDVGKRYFSVHRRCFLKGVQSWHHLLVFSWSAASSWPGNNASVPWPLRRSAVPSGDFILTFPRVNTRNSGWARPDTTHNTQMCPSCHNWPEVPHLLLLIVPAPEGKIRNNH